MDDAKQNGRLIQVIGLIIHVAVLVAVAQALACGPCGPTLTETEEQQNEEAKVDAMCRNLEIDIHNLMSLEYKEFPVAMGEPGECSGGVDSTRRKTCRFDNKGHRFTYFPRCNVGVFRQEHRYIIGFEDGVPMSITVYPDEVPFELESLSAFGMGVRKPDDKFFDDGSMRYRMIWKEHEGFHVVVMSSTRDGKILYRFDVYRIKVPWFLLEGFEYPTCEERVEVWTESVEPVVCGTINGLEKQVCESMEGAGQ